MPLRIPTIDDVRAAEAAVRPHVSPAPLIRSYPMEKELGFTEGRRVWIKDYGWTPVGSFKLLGALNWVANNLDRIGSRTMCGPFVGKFRVRDFVCRDAVWQTGRRGDARDRPEGEIQSHSLLWGRNPHLRHHARRP